MEKIAAMVKTAEVAGVLDALVEADLLKVASEEEFGVIVDAVTDHLPEGYDVTDVIEKTAEILDYAQEGAGHEKEAELSETEYLAYLGELALLKEAGEITEQEFQKEAASPSVPVQALKRGRKYLKDTVEGSPALKYLRGGFKGERLKDVRKHREARSAVAEKLQKARSQTAGAPKHFREDAVRYAAPKGRRPGKSQYTTADGVNQILASYGTAGGTAGGLGYGGYRALRNRDEDSE